MIVIQIMMMMTMIKEKEKVKFRHEIKHIITNAEAYILSNRLKKIFKYDENANSHGVYRVSSIYFDTPYDKALRQKIDGVNNREKFRIRYYNENMSFIRLEKKIKKQGLCAKLSKRISFDELKKILDSNIDFLIHKQDPLLLEFYSKIKGELLFPKKIIVYDREAFLYEVANVRITIDRNIKTSMSKIEFLSQDRNLVDISNNISVLEVKYDEFLPDIVRLLVKIPNRFACSFSKYQISRQFD